MTVLGLEKTPPNGRYLPRRYRAASAEILSHNPKYYPPEGSRETCTHTARLTSPTQTPPKQTVVEIELAQTSYYALIQQCLLALELVTDRRRTTDKKQRARARGRARA